LTKEIIKATRYKSDEVARYHKVTRIENLRDAINGKKNIEKINKCVDNLLAISTDLSKNKKTYDSFTIMAIKTRCDCLKIIIETEFNFLKKVLPDIRNIEIQEKLDDEKSLRSLAAAFREAASYVA